MANGIEILVQSSVYNDVPQVGEGKTITAFDFVTMFRGILKPGAIDPGNSGGHRRKVDMFDDSMCIAGLAFAAAAIALIMVRPCSTLPM